MNSFIQKINLTFFYRIMLSLLLICTVACSKDDRIDFGDKEFEIEDYTVETEDALSVASDLPAYVFPYEYKNFGAALVRRLNNQIATLDENSYGVASVVIHSSMIENFKNENELPLFLIQMMLGHNIIIIEPTIKDFNLFCDIITEIYLVLLETEEGKELLKEIDAIPGVRQTFEAFYEMSKDPSKITSMFLLNTDHEGIFAEAIAVRGCDFHIVDRMKGVEQTDISHEIIEETGTLIPSEAPQIDVPEGGVSETAITPYTYGLFADMFTKWINEQEYYMEEMKEMRTRGAKTFNTRAESTTKLNLEDISSVQKVQYTMNVPTPYNTSSPLPVTVSFEICSIYKQEENSDYYCIYKKIISYNQLLKCGPEENRKWRYNKDFGYYKVTTINNTSFKEYREYPYYGPFMRDISGQSICHAHTDKFINSSNTAVVLPKAESIERLSNVVIEKSSPQNSIGSSDHTSGFSYGFDGGLYLATEPSINIGFSVSYDTSTTQSIDDLEIEASSIDGIAKWDYVGKNLPDAFYNVILTNSHSSAPSIMRMECPVDQSWIWRVPNPSGSYRLYDETSVTTSIMYYTDGFMKALNKYVNNETTKRVSFLMMPPPRSEQIWAMDVTPYSEELNTMLSTTHSRFWNKDNQELKLADTSEESRISIKEFISDFEQDLNNKRITWKNRHFLGNYTFSFYNINDPDKEIISFDFKVE